MPLPVDRFDNPAVMELTVDKRRGYLSAPKRPWAALTFLPLHFTETYIRWLRVKITDADCRTVKQNAVHVSVRLSCGFRPLRAASSTA
ncbi:hypothetical protein RV134_380017 [Roseovarius sp. EC-HK134]|nr:hypothetical protein RV420_460084 [Roseovarius sp. EC-SD190]VVT33201.1 hypothetical protein RV134_380017 [Roseovarius sp. EC-HK134]